MLEDFEGTKEEFVTQLATMMKDKAEEKGLALNSKKAMLYAEACRFMYQLCEESFGDLVDIDYEPGESCTVSAQFDSMDISGELFPWFRDLIAKLDGLKFLPNHEE